MEDTFIPGLLNPCLCKRSYEGEDKKLIGYCHDNPIYTKLKRKQWEYLEVNKPDADLDEYGKEGWELVAITFNSEAYDGYENTAFFKRPIE